MVSISIVKALQVKKYNFVMKTNFKAATARHCQESRAKRVDFIVVLLKSFRTTVKLHLRDNPTLRIRKSFHRHRTLPKIIKFKGVSLFQFRDTEIRSRSFFKFHATEVYWWLKICSGILGALQALCSMRYHILSWQYSACSTIIAELFLIVL